MYHVCNKFELNNILKHNDNVTTETVLRKFTTSDGIYR